jgi:arabinan endo-1,5-alpha-L-arabinosidase
MIGGRERNDRGPARSRGRHRAASSVKDFRSPRIVGARARSGAHKVLAHAALCIRVAPPPTVLALSACFLIHSLGGCSSEAAGPNPDAQATAGRPGGSAPTGGAGSGGTGGELGRAGSTGGSPAASGGAMGGNSEVTGGGYTVGGVGGEAAGGAGGGGGAGGKEACPGAAYDPASPPEALTLSGNLGAHDPAAYVVGETVYLAATGLAAKTSTNLTSWMSAGNPLPARAGAWAPDISYFGGAFHLYYAVSSFGSNESCIGQATRAALDSGSWTDKGNVICSNMGATKDNWNAIDPNVVLDDAGVPWLALGSFWGGIKMVKLNSDGARADDVLYDLASGPAGGAIEGAFVFKRCDYYYLFVSFGSCCSSPYNYNMRVGRSAVVTGPYVDKEGKPLASGGGSLLVEGNSTWSAPGHNAVIVYEHRTYNVYHALAAPSGKNGAAMLRIAEIVWSADGWPVSGGP